MDKAAFQLNKFRRAIRVQGRPFTFKRPKKNLFGEPTDETESCVIMGVFHENTEYASKTTSEASTIRQKSSPMVLMLWEDAFQLHQEDLLDFNGKPFRVNEIKNIAEANLVADVYLEEVQT